MAPRGIRPHGPYRKLPAVTTPVPGVVPNSRQILSWALRPMDPMDRADCRSRFVRRTHGYATRRSGNPTIGWPTHLRNGRVPLRPALRLPDTLELSADFHPHPTVRTFNGNRNATRCDPRRTACIRQGLNGPNPDLPIDQLDDLVWWFRKEASALDVGLISMDDEVSQQYALLKRDKLDRFAIPDIAFMLLFWSAMCAIIGGIGYLGS